MPPKKQPSKADQPKKADLKDEDPLQAVVLADSYNRRFEVLCLDRPRILLPLCGIPLLTWTLEALSMSGVKQVLLFCGVHSEQIREFVDQSPYRQTMNIKCISSQTARTPGDAMRELDSMGVLNADSPFILVHGPIISNYDLSRMIAAHKKRREGDSNYIMTMGLGLTGRPHPESPIMLVHEPSSRLMHYALNPLQPSTSHISFPSSLFCDPFPPTIESYEIWSGPSSSSSRPGYTDLGIDICELDVAALCTENFDFHDLRRHFVNGVLTSELLGKKIAVHLVGHEEDEAESSGHGKGKYVERVRDTRTYGDISRDVLRRWAFPFAPDLNPLGGAEYELRARNIYIAKDNVTLQRSTQMEGPLLIGPLSSLQASTKIYQSVLGASTTLGPRSVVINAYIFDSVIIGADCYLEECIIGNNVILGDGVVIGKGVLIGDGVVIGKKTRIPDFARIGREPFRPEGWEEGDEEDWSLPDIEFGEGSEAHAWPQEEEQPDEDSDDEAEDPYEHPSNKRLLQLGRSLSDLSNTSIDSLSTLSKASSSPDSEASDLSDTSLPDIPTLNLGETGPSEAFTKEAQITLSRGHDEGHSMENIGTEMGLLFPAYNAGVDAARQEIVYSILTRIPLTGNPQQVLSATISIFSKWRAIFPKFSPDYTSIIYDVQQYALENEEMKGYFGILLRGLYESDLVDENVLVRWRDSERANVLKGEDDEEERQGWREIYKRGKVYVDVLEQMESDDDDDDDEDEDEEQDGDSD